MRRYQLTNSVRDRREGAGLSQAALAARLGTSRQALHAIESGRAVPGTGLALRLAAALHCRVEELFSVPGSGAEVTARLTGSPSGAAPPVRVRLAMAGPRAVAVPLTGGLAAVAALPQADGVVCAGQGERVRVRLLTPVERLAETVVVAGCDPALPLVAAHLERIQPRYRLTWLPGGSLQALRWLRDGAAHVAGLHLRDHRTGQDNIPLVRRILGDRRAVVLAFATWEQGLIVAPGNPRSIRGVADLERSDLAIINREKGSGARALLDAAVEARGLSAARIRGYDREAPSHLAVAQTVSLGLVDAGIGIRAAARAFGLSFLPLQQERYDLVVPSALLDHPPVQAFLDAVGTAAVREELRAVGDYDTRRLGTTLAVLPGGGPEVAGGPGGARR